MSVTPHSHSQHSQQHAHITTAEPAALHAHQHAHTGLRYHSPHTTLPLARSHTSSHTPTPSTGIRILAHTSTGTNSTTRSLVRFAHSLTHSLALTGRWTERRSLEAGGRGSCLPMGVGSDRGLAPPQQSRERLSEGARATERGSEQVSLSHSYHHNFQKASPQYHAICDAPRPASNRE